MEKEEASSSTIRRWKHTRLVVKSIPPTPTPISTPESPITVSSSKGSQGMELVLYFSPNVEPLEVPGVKEQSSSSKTKKATRI